MGFTTSRCMRSDDPGLRYIGRKLRVDSWWQLVKGEYEYEHCRVLDHVPLPTESKEVEYLIGVDKPP